MTVARNKPVVIDPERTVQRELKKPEHFVFRIEVEAKDRKSDVFLVLKSSTLDQLADTLIEEALAMGNLRVVFVRIDTNADLFFDKVQELDTPGLLRKLFRVTAPEQINRVLHAWCDRRADLTVASAYVEDDELVVQACDLQRYRVRFADFPGLSELPEKQRDKFEVDEVGNHVFWPGQNVSIDLDAVRYKVDSEFRKAKDKDALSDYKKFLGRAVEAVMSDHKLTQAVIRQRGGPDERHLYRLMKGQQDLTPTMIDRLCKAHGLSHEEYVRELVQACDDIVEQEAEELYDA